MKKTKRGLFYETPCICINYQCVVCITSCCDCFYLICLCPKMLFLPVFLSVYEVTQKCAELNENSCRFGYIGLLTVVGLHFILPFLFARWQF